MKWPSLKLSFLLLAWGMMMNGCQSDDQLNAEDWFKQELIFEKAEDYVNAINAYTKALEINPRYAKVYQHRGTACSRQDDYEQAIIDFTEAIRLNPRHAEVYNFRGMAWSNKNKNDLAIVDFTQAIEVNPRYADAFNNRGVSWFDKGNLQQALADIGKALDLKPEDQRNKMAETLLETRIKNFKIEY